MLCLGDVKSAKLLVPHSEMLGEFYLIVEDIASP